METIEIKLVTGEMMRIPLAEAKTLGSSTDRFVRVTALNADGTFVGHFDLNPDNVVWMGPVRTP